MKLHRTKPRPLRGAVLLTIVVCLLAAPSGWAQGDKGQSAPENESHDYTAGDIDACRPTASDLIDADGDGLSDQVEICWLGTSYLDRDTDGDGLYDGVDASPTQGNSPIPLNVQIVAFNMNQIPDQCDEGTTWDPYLTAFGIDIATLQVGANLEFDGWLAGAHQWDRPNQNPSPVISSINGAPQAVPSSTLTWQLDQDLQTWDGGLSGLHLLFHYGALMVDDDTNLDDYMAFNIPDFDILRLGGATFSLVSEYAYDGNTNLIGCRTEVVIKFTYIGLTEQILDTATQRGAPGPEGIVQCSDSQMNGCRLNGNWL